MPPSDFSLMHLYPIDGAVRRVAKDATAWQRARRVMVDGHRRNRSRSEEGRCAEGVGTRLLEGGAPFNQGGGYVNFMMDDEQEGRLEATYGENYKRLAAIKATYDPNNLFRVNQNIAPAPAAAPGRTARTGAGSATDLGAGQAAG